jgi:DNA replication protein DnaC
MLTHPTLEQLKELKLTGMAEAFAEMAESPQANELSHPEWLALLLDREASERSNKRLKRLLRAARLRESQASVEDVDTRAKRRLDKALFRELANCNWIRQHRNLIITGPCGPEPGWRTIRRHGICGQLTSCRQMLRGLAS